MRRYKSVLAVVGLLGGTMAVQIVSAEAATYTSTGVRCTIVGTLGADTLYGTNRRDVICGRGGQDFIAGRGGGDLVDGGPGNDRLRGGLGTDRLLGGGGNDTLVGGDGRDAMLGGFGVDFCNAGVGDTTSGCRSDFADPVVELLSPSSNQQFDIEASSQQITLSARVTSRVAQVTEVSLALLQPTGNGYAVHKAGGELVSGTSLDGVWETVVPVSQSEPVGPWFVEATIRKQTDPNPHGAIWVTPDRYHVWAGGDISVFVFKGQSGLVHMVEDVPGEPTTITLFSRTPASVDVGTAPATVNITLQAHDPDDSGTSAVYVGLHSSDGSVVIPSEPLALTQGSPQQGTWTGSVELPEGTAPGYYYPRVWIEDENHSRDYVPVYSPYAQDWTQLTLSGQHLVTVTHGD